MSFLHTIATKRKQMKEAGDAKGLMNLPRVTVFEKASAPGGVWRNIQNDADGKDSSNGSTNMYEGLWINAHKDGMEFFDYTFKDHFKTPQPVYLPRQQILEYVLARVTQHEDIFKDVNFNTEVQSVTYDDQTEHFVIQTKNDRGMKMTEHFDKCIWAAGLNGTPKMIPEIVEKLSSYKGQIVHSTEMNKLASDETNAVKGKHILMIGDNYSAEDLALQCLKLGAEQISIASRTGGGSACDMGSWPGDKVDILYYSQVAGVKDDGLGTTILFDALREDYPVPDLEDVSIIIFCTGYKVNDHFLPKNLRPFPDDCENRTWCLEDIGLETATWRMKSNPLTEVVDHVEPSKALNMNYDHFRQKCYRNLLISNPNMMFIQENSDYPLLEIDVSAWSCLAYITGENQVPTEKEMQQAVLSDLLHGMDDYYMRYELDENYAKACDAIHEDHWFNDTTCDEYKSHFVQLYSFCIKVVARDMKDAKYPMQFGDINQLNKVGTELVRMMSYDSFGHFDLWNCDDETKCWKTFRDTDPSPFRSLLTGMGSTSLKGKWLEIDDEGNPHSTSG
jgi:thioredoxin reductase